MRIDNALEFSYSACNQFFDSHGILHQKSCAYRPQQNARVERKHRYILEVARALRFQAGLPLNLWGACVMTAVHLINRLPSFVLGNKTPYEKLYNTPPTYDHVKTFGCLAFATNPSITTDKFAHRGIPAIFLGYPPLTKGHILLNLLTQKHFVTRDATFIETVFPYHQNSIDAFMKPIPPSYPQTTLCEDIDMFSSLESSDEEQTDTKHVNPESIPTTPVTSVHTQPISTSPPPLRRTTRPHVQPVWMQDYVNPVKPPSTTSISNVAITAFNPNFHCFLATHTNNTDPIRFQTAIQSAHWVEAINQELDALELNNTWTVTTLPPGKRPIGCKWIFKTKLNADGTLDKYKARLVILGCHQKYGIDYAETFAPVAKLTTVRTLLAVAAIENWYTCQMDVSNAFLHGDLVEDVYMKIPQGYTQLGSRITFNASLDFNPDHSLVCKLNKSLYGLKQAPRLWFAKLSSTLLSLDYAQSKTDYILFVNHTSTDLTIILVYVDDLLITGNCMTSINSLKQMLAKTFHMKDLGPLRYFLGLEIDRTASGIFLCQKKYTLDIIKEHGLENARPLQLPMDANIKLSTEKGDPLSNPVVYQRLVGKLIYLTITRPDICFIVQLLFQFMQSPTTVHF